MFPDLHAVKKYFFPHVTCVVV